MGKFKQRSSLVKNTQPKKPQGGVGKHGGTQGKKPGAFKVSSHKALKAKHKTKQVTSSLKWINPKTSKEQVRRNDASFSGVQHSMASLSKAASKSTAKTQVHVAKETSKKADERDQVDVDAAMEQMASL